MYGVKAANDFIGDNISRRCFRTIETVRQRKDFSIVPSRHTGLTITFHHHLIYQSKLVIKINAHIPMHPEKRVSPHIDAYRFFSHGNRPKHCHHIGTAKPQSQKVRTHIIFPDRHVSLPNVLCS